MCSWRWCSRQQSSAAGAAPITAGRIYRARPPRGGGRLKVRSLCTSMALKRGQGLADGAAAPMRRASPPRRPPSTVSAPSVPGFPQEGRSRKTLSAPLHLAGRARDKETAERRFLVAETTPIPARSPFSPCCPAPSPSPPPARSCSG